MESVIGITPESVIGITGMRKPPAPARQHLRRRRDRAPPEPVELPTAHLPLGHRVAQVVVVHARRAIHCAKELDERVRDTGPGLLAQREKMPLHVLATECVEAPVEPMRRMRKDSEWASRNATP